MFRWAWVLMTVAACCLLAGCGSGSGSTPSTVTWNEIPITNQIARVNTARDGYVVLADFDHNGVLDAASGFGSDGSVVVHIQSSPQAWTSTVVANGLGSIHSLATADLTQRSRTDIVAATGSGNVWLLFSPGFTGPEPGTFTPSALVNPVFVTSWDDVKIGQFDNISQLQIVATSAAGGVIGLWRAQTLVTSGADYQPFVIASFAQGFERLAVADIDRDGYLDIVAVGPTGGVVWLQNPSGANVTGLWPVHRISSELGLTRLVLGDLLKNGQIDVVATNRATGQVVWFENTGSPRTDIWPEHVIANISSGGPDALGIGDLDNSGSLELLVGTKTTNQSIFWLRAFNDPRSPWEVQQITQTGFDVGELPVGNIDNVNGLDFATTLAGSDTPVVWFQQQ